MADTDLRFAVLIDADNVSEKYVEVILDEVANAGVATYKRIYGDWTSQRLASWKGCLLENSITPMQQYSYTTGKNATDSAMIIDAMDILYSGHVDGFAIVSSDSDFTRLAARLRESGMLVIGMGEQKTPEPFISACNQFKYLDLLLAARTESSEPHDDATLRESARPRRRPGDAGGASSNADQEPASGEQEGARDLGDVEFAELSRAAKRRHMKRIRTAVNAIIDQFSDEDGWLFVGRLGSELAKRLPDFDVRNYGYKKLSLFLKSLGVYEFDERPSAGGAHVLYLRIKQD